jgi:hypothetical protein
MNFRTNAKVSANVDGTCLQGSIQASKDELVKTFGPAAISIEPRVNDIWTIQFGDGTIAVIYDWKSEPRPDAEPYNWRIGGFAPIAVSRVHEEYRAAHGLSARAA